MIRPVGGPAPGPAGVARARRAGGFHLPADAAAAAGGVAGTAGVGALFAMQEALTPRERDDAAQRRGQALLEEMEALRRDLLRGAMPAARLSRLAVLAEGEAGADPALREVVEALSLRARVELERHRIPGNGNSA
ncbi:flagellar assembly protein FliX [Roseococcus sp. DSY-14]|uniref:flagellar assembly protein FliX n=1 Tax=Roseococcus sp. DSY-14 TaxID=3369650 RepID=UPI00387A9C38